MIGWQADLRAAARGLGRAPGFTAAAVATLVVAIGVNAALFSFVNAVFFRGLPYPDADALHEIRLAPAGRAAWTAPRVADVRDVLDGTAVGAYVERAYVVAGGADAPPARLIGTAIEPGTLDLIGIPWIAGRPFETTDALPGAPGVAIIDADLAEALFGSATAAVGEVLRIDGVERTVTGVVPPGFAFPDFARLWIPLPGAAERRTDEVRLMARLDGVDPEIATRRLESLETGEATRAQLRPLQPRVQAEVPVILGAVSFLLLIACANVANLVLARGTARMHELGVRAVLGATRARLLRVLVAEGVVMAGAAAIGGAVLGAWLTDVVVGLIPADQLPLWFRAELDLRVVTWIAAAAAMSTILASGLPALVLTRGGLTGMLATGGLRGADGRGGRLRVGLIAAELALATTLLAGAGVLARSLVEMRRADPGYDAHRVLQFELHRVPTAAADRFIDEAVRALADLSEVERAAARLPATVSGRIVVGDETADALVEAVTPGFFEAIGLSMVRGRTFTAAEAEEGSVALLSESLATRLFGTAGEAIGREVSLGDDVTATVVGVTATRRMWFAGGLEGTRPAAHVYLPARHGDANAFELLARSTGADPLDIALPGTERLRGLDADLVLRPARTLVEVERERATDLRVFATLFGGFGALALALAALGIYGVVAYTVSRRTREIGVRVALGATSRRIAAHVARGVLPPVLAGLGLGLVGAFAVTRLMRGVLFGVTTGDPLLMALVLGTFLATAALAAWLPARRAARIDPLTALRME